MLHSRLRSPRLFGASSLVGILAWCLSALVQAQTPTPPPTPISTTLVGNTDQDFSLFSMAYFAQSFTTGRSLLGYELDGADLALHVLAGTADSSSSVWIRSDLAGSPGSVIAKLSPPSSYTDGLNAFSLSPSLVLQPSKRYWFTIGEAVGTVMESHPVYLTSSAADAGLEGWSLSDTVRRASQLPPHWSLGSSIGTQQSSVQVRLTGRAVPFVYPVSATVDGPDLAVRFDAPLDPATPVALSDFVVQIDGPPLAFDEDASYTITGSTLDIELPRYVFSGQPVQISYSSLSPLIGTHGGPLLTFADLFADNITPVDIASVEVTSTPTIQSSYVDGDVIEFTLSFAAAVTLLDGAVPSFTFDIDGPSRSASYVSGADTAALVFGYTVEEEDMAEVPVSWPARALSLDGAQLVYVDDKRISPSLEIPAGVAPDHYVNLYDSLPPSLVSARVAGRTLTLEFDEPLSDVVPPLEAFTVIKSSEHTPLDLNSPLVSGPEVSGSTVRFTLDYGVALTDSQISLYQNQAVSDLRFADLLGNTVDPFVLDVDNATLAPSCARPSPVGRRVVWHAELQPANLAEPADLSTPGYGFFGSMPARGIGFGEIDHPHFTLLDRALAVQAAHVFDFRGELPLSGGSLGMLLFTLSSPLSPMELAYLRLHVCGRSFSFSDFDSAPYSNLEVDYRWADSQLDWSSLAPVSLALSMPEAFMSAPAVADTTIVAPDDGAPFDALTPIDVVVHFDSAVDVGTESGVPTVSLLLDDVATPVDASYHEGSGTADLVFRHTPAIEVHSVTLLADSLSLNGGALFGSDSGIAAQLPHRSATVHMDLMGAHSARFVNVPAYHDGTHPLELFLEFTDVPDALTADDLISGAVLATGADVVEAQPVALSDDRRWLLRVVPNSLDDVVVEVPSRACATEFAICFAGEPLRAPASTTIHSIHYRLVYESFPAVHDAVSAFTVRFRVSPAPHALDELSVRRSLFDITGGRFVAVSAVSGADHDVWDLTLVPDSLSAVVLTPRVAFECHAVSGVCDGSHVHPDSIEIPGPPYISVANAQVDEDADDARLVFVLDLSVPLEEALSVDYVAISGSALAGDDFAETSGILTFDAGVTLREVSIEVYPDSVDEGDENMFLRLSNPTLDYVALVPGEATGVIRNGDPLPGAWLARFGRTVASQAVDALEVRFARSLVPGLSGTFLGLSVTGASAGVDDGPLASAVFGSDTVFDSMSSDRLDASSAWSGRFERSYTLSDVLSSTSLSYASDGGQGGWCVGVCLGAWCFRRFRRHCRRCLRRWACRERFPRCGCREWLDAWRPHALVHPFRGDLCG